MYRNKQFSLTQFFSLAHLWFCKFNIPCMLRGLDARAHIVDEVQWRNTAVVFKLSPA